MEQSSTVPVQIRHQSPFIQSILLPCRRVAANSASPASIADEQSSIDIKTL
jgi:hypothetical protein